MALSQSIYPGEKSVPMKQPIVSGNSAETKKESDKDSRLTIEK